MIARILFLATLLVGPPALAADNATLITPCASGCVTVRAKDIGGGVQSFIQILGDTAGTPLATAPGTPNASFALPIQGVTGGTALPVSAAALPLPTGAATSALQTTGNTALTTINTTLGTPFQAGGSIGNTTFAATQAGTWTVQPGNTANTTPWLVSVPTWAGGTLGAMANYGTSPGAVLVPGVNAFITNANSNIATNADGVAAVAAGATGSSPVNSYGYVFNGTTFDRVRSGTQTGSVAVASADPCLGANKTPFTISTTSGTVQLVPPSGSTQVYICSLVTVGATASIENLVGGTGATCTTGTPVAMAGSTTAANGMSFAANGGFTFGNGGGTVLRTTTAGHGVCLIQSATAQISGGGTFVQQ